MKNLLNLNQLSVISRDWTENGPKTDREWTENRPTRLRVLAKYAAMMLMLLTLGVGQMWATVTIYAVGNMQDNGGTWRDEKTTLYCHNWGSSGTTWPGTSMTKWNDVSVDGHQVFKCNLKADGNTSCIFNTNGGWQTNDITNLNSTVKAYPYPTYLNGTWYYSPRVCKALWESDQHAYGGRIYFDNSSASWGDTYMYFVIGHGSYVGYYRITNIGNTKLYYVDLGSQSWGDSKYVAVVGNSSSKTTGSGNPNNLAALTHFSDAYQYSLEYQSTYLVSMSSGTNCSQISMDYKSGGYSDFNSTQTINTVVKAAGGSYTSANSKATISITSYEMTGDGAVTKRTPSISTSAKQATVSAARTATTTLSVGDVATGYQFDGWYTAATGGTQLSSSTTYTYYPTAATTVYARFSEKTFTVTVTNDGNGTTSPSGAQTNKGQITGVAVSATPSDGYNFNNWTITSGTGSFADATDESTTFYPTGTATIRANFVSAATSTLMVTATAGGSITTPAAGYYSDITTTGYSIAASRSEGYKFTGWTKTAGDGAVSFANASSLSTTATITTLGDVTVTAGFAAMSNSLSVSSSSVYAGSDVTLTATKTNHTLDLKYQYKIGTGSWNTITTKSGTSHTYTIPYANTYQTYYFRVVSTDGSTDIISPTQTVEVKGRITIHVKNTNSWASLYLYSWYSTSTTTNGAWPGKTGTGLNNQSCSIHATGSQWWDVTITQETATAQKFILNCNTSGDQNQTGDLTLSSFTHDAYYAMSTNASSNQTLSTTTTPAAPTLSTSAAGTIRETSAVLGGNVTNLGNDIISERGYYWSTNSALSSSNLGVGTKVTVSGTQSSTGTFSSTKSSLTAGTKYYFIAYAKNGYGTSYGAVNNFTTLSTYTVTVTAGDGGSASPSSVTAGQYLASETITASPNTDYVFYNWTKTSGSGTVTFTNANAASTTVKSTSTATVRANFVDKWTIKGSGTELGAWGTYNSMTPTGNTDEYSVTVALAASTTYDFKVVNRVNGGGDGTFYGKSSTTFTREGTTSVTGLVTTAGDTYNMHLTTDIAGNYTFTFKYNASTSSMKVTVGFPTAYKLTYGIGTIKGTNGSITCATASGSYVASGNSVTLTGPAAKSGYTWKGWYTNAAGTTGNIADVDRAITVTMNATKTLYACYNYATYTATLSTTGRTGYGSGAPANQTVTYLQDMPTITPPTAANGYCFMGYWDGEEGTGTQYYKADGTSARTWNKTAGATLYAYFKKAEITAITFDAATVEASGTVRFAVTVSPTPVGSTKLCFTVLYSNDNPLSPQPTISGPTAGKYSFTAPAASGTYKVEAVLRTGSSCAGGTELDTEEATFTVAGLHTVTVRYKCGDEVIRSSSTVTGRPLDWSDAIVAPDIFGYTFSSWTAGDGVTIKDGETSTATTHIKAIYDGTLTANYTQNNYIYFKDNLGWTNPNDANAHVYLNLYTADYWTTNKGSGNNGVTNRNLQMDRVPGTTNIFYYNYGNKTTSRYVSFTKESMATYENFYQTSPAVAHVVFPTRSSDALGTDKATGLGFYSKTPMFVPQPIAEADGKLQNDSRARYYNDGYWTKYTPGTGYTLQVYYEDGSTSKGDYVFTSEDELMPMKAVVDLEAGRNYKFQLKRDGDVTYGNTGTMTYANHGQSVAWEYNQGVGKTTITTNAAGEYVFTLSYAANASQYRLRISVDYPIANGDYRVIYKHTGQANYKASAIIPKVNNGKDTVSFFIKPKSSPSMKIQQATVNGSTGAITWSSGTDVSASVSSLAKDSVYNICLTMNGSGTISVEKVEPYTGNYYIRTDAANSKWDNYRSDPDHLMTYSEYSITHGGYSHYYCHWVQTDDRKNVKFCIANDYSPSISDTLTRETASGTWANIATFIESNGDIKRNANVRFMWNRHDNTIARAYVDGAQENGSRFLVISSTDGKIKKADGSALSNNEVTFSDNENWIYEANVKAQPTSQYKLISTWGTGTVITQYFKGTSGSTETLIDGSGTDWYDIRLLYDFKTNRLVAAWVPSDATITVNNAINADVMFIREHQGDIAQLTFSASGKISKIETAYGVIKFNKWTLANKDKSTHSPLGSPASIYERSLFWISFPFRVKLSEVFGFGTYGKHWAIQRYDGAKRAEIGHFAENGSFWRWMDRNSEYLEPNQGYLLAIDLDLLGESSDVWGPDSRSVQIELYFPSYGTMPDISNASVTQTIPEHECTINWAATQGLPDTGDPRTSYNRTIFDSHWNVMSVPTYVNTTAVSFANTTWKTAIGPRFLYSWNASDNTITATTASGYTYHAMHSYMVQYAGNLTWTASSGSPASIVARKTYAETPKEVEFRLELQQNEQEIDRTFIVLSNDEEVSADFQFGEDMTKEFNAKKSAIYTFIADEAVAAGNTLPMSEQTTVVPVGVDIKADGDYTFAMPDGTSGVGVVLIDNETGIRTSLSALDYTVFLEAGTYDKRFMMEISPIKQGTTGIDLINGDASANGVRKLLIDQKMYIIKGDKMYDATGRRVE